MNQSKAKFIVCFLLIVLTAGIDYQLFSEGMGQLIAPKVRQAGHIILLFPIALLGKHAWRQQPYDFIKKLWNVSYIAAMFLLLAAGFLQYMFNLFPEAVLDELRLMRLIFCSPLPFLSLAMLVWLIKREQITV